MAAVRSRRLRTPPRATRSKASISYAESSSDSELGAYFDAVASDSEDSRPAPRSRTATRSARSVRTSTPRRQHKRNRSDLTEYTNTPKRAKTSRSSKPSTPKAVVASTIEFVKGSGIIPEWQSLPHFIWLRIFQFAAYPLCDEQFRSLPSAQWLVKVATVCRKFATEALAVLYSSPPLIPKDQAHGLVHLLQESPERHHYRQKIRSLQIEVKNVVVYSLAGRGHLHLYSLIKDLPLLTNLEFYHEYDMPPYRELDTTIKWRYLDEIFNALEYVDPAADAERKDKTSVSHLKSWRWSSRLAGDKYPIEDIAALHRKPYFMTLRKIAFVNYQVPFLKKDEEDPKHEKALADAITALPHLEHLTFECSTLVNSTLLPLLPTGLRHLELINCWEVVAADFAEFLLTHGRMLRCLTLNHNQSLSLSFLPVLGEGCPNLEILHMNLTYFNLHATYRDSEPQYDQLLLPDQVPVWPSTLQTIELIHLRKWETDAAEMFFQSLLDAAGNLPDLRKLSLQAILNIGWRDRASFRDKWVGSLDRVFKRVSEPPLHRISLRALPTPEQPLNNTGPSNENHAVESSKRSSRRSTSSKDAGPSTPPPIRTITLPRRSRESPPARRSARTSTLTTKTGKYAESSSEAELEEPVIPTTTPRRNNRLARELEVLRATAGSDTPVLSNSNSNSDSDSDTPLVKSKSKDKGKGKEAAKEQVIQGMCDIVEVRIDNLRPTENQVTEADFLDEERSGDEDWDGQDGADDGYAW